VEATVKREWKKVASEKSDRRSPKKPRGGASDKSKDHRLQRMKTDSARPSKPGYKKIFWMEEEV